MLKIFAKDRIPFYPDSAWERFHSILSASYLNVTKNKTAWTTPALNAFFSVLPWHVSCMTGPHAIRRPRRHTKYVIDSQLRTDLVWWNRVDTCTRTVPAGLTRVLSSHRSRVAVLRTVQSPKTQNNGTPCPCGNFSDTGVKQVRLQAGEQGLWSPTWIKIIRYMRSSGGVVPLILKLGIRETIVSFMPRPFHPQPRSPPPPS